MSSAAAAAASRSKLKQQALFARIPLQPTTNAAAPRLHLLCSRVRFSGQGRVKHHSMTNLRLPPPCALPCTARGGCSLAKATPPRGACGPTRTALQPPSLFNRSSCTLPTATPRAQRTLLWAVASAARRMPLRPCSTHALPLHTPPHHLPPFPAWRACTPVTRMQHECSAAPCLSTPQRSTRGVAPRNIAARVAKATMDLFQKTNKM